MNKKLLVSTLSILAMLDAFAALAQNADSRMSFFITSVGPGDGANLGGLAGPMRTVKSWPMPSGSETKPGRAYLSSTGQGGVNARDRDRQRALAQRQRRSGGERRGRLAQRPKQALERELNRRKGRGRERPWGRPQPARYSDRL